jgi:hypothetical protein
MITEKKKSQGKRHTHTQVGASGNLTHNTRGQQNQSEIANFTPGRNPSRGKVLKQIARTEGLISTDRGTRATLMRTIPRSILSHIQKICLFQYLELCFSIA